MGTVQGTGEITRFLALSCLHILWMTLEEVGLLFIEGAKTFGITIERNQFDMCNIKTSYEEWIKCIGKRESFCSDKAKTLR